MIRFSVLSLILSTFGWSQPGHYRFPRLQWHPIQWNPGYSDSFDKSQMAFHIPKTMWLEWHLLRVTLFSCPKGVNVSGEDCIAAPHSFPISNRKHRCKRRIQLTPTKYIIVTICGGTLINAQWVMTSLSRKQGCIILESDSITNWWRQLKKNSKITQPPGFKHEQPNKWSQFVIW